MLLIDITPEDIGKYQGLRQKQKASNRTINMEVSTLRMILKASRLWSALADDVKMLPERKDVGRALTADEEKRLREACKKSPQPSLYTAVVAFCNTGLRNAELRRARWSQVDLMRSEFQVGKSKTAGGEGRIVPLNLAALGVLKEWRSRWPDAQPTDFIFPSEKLMYKGQGAAETGKMTSYAVNPSKPLGAWKRGWSSVKKQAGVECRIHDLRHHFISALARHRHRTQLFKLLADI
jgi:integrase